MSFLRHFFPSPQLRDCRFALSAMRKRFEYEVAWSEIHRRAYDALSREEESIKHRMLILNDRAKDVVGDIVAAICFRDIECGANHIYRGVLSITGQSKRNIFAGIVADQIRDGWINLQDAAVANENMKRAVAGVG